MNGIGMKSKRTEAKELFRNDFSIRRISEMLDVSEQEVQEWIWGKQRTSASRGRGSVSPASQSQRAKCKGKACVVCRHHAGNCSPAHLIDRSIGGDDDPRAVIPLCPGCHRAYDEGNGQGSLDLLPHLEPHYREEVAYAVELVGLLRALQRITNTRFEPVDERSVLASGDGRRR